jgi:hypothetical protein
VGNDLNKLSQEVAEHRGKVDEFIINTVNYRKDLCGKMDKLFNLFSNLPCKERSGWYKSMDRQVGFMWVVLGGLLLAILTIGINGIFDRDDMKKTLAILKNNSIAEAQCLKDKNVGLR